jgi:hypothetical protein
MLTVRHISRFFSLEYLGGPFIFLLIILGALKLRAQDKPLYQFFVYWILATIFLLSFVILAARNHLMDFNWAIALLISLGILSLGKLIKRNYFYLFIVLVVLYNLILVNHVAWSRIYDQSENLIIQAYSQEIRKINPSDREVIAVNLDAGGVYELNYLTNQSIVLFTPQTIKNLLAKDELDSAFDKFKVNYLLGYSKKLSEQVAEETSVKIIAFDSLKPIKPEISRNRAWLMNIIK